jgi:predicted ATPase
VAAAFLSVIERLSDHRPVLLAIDDLQWLDRSSVHVIAFAARRRSGPVGFLGTVRTEPDSGGATSWLQLPRPDAIHRIAVHPLSARGNDANSTDLGRKPVLCHRIGPRPR